MASVAVASGCGTQADQADVPTVKEVQEETLAQQQAYDAVPPEVRYPPLPAPDFIEEQPDPPYNGPGPVVDENALQPGQDPVRTAMFRIQEIAAKTADISNRAQEARENLAHADPFLDVVDGKVDDKTWAELQAGFDDLRAALDRSASGDVAAAATAAEDASGRIQLAVQLYTGVFDY